MVLVSLFDTCTLELIYTTSLFVANISIELSPVTLRPVHNTTLNNVLRYVVFTLMLVEMQHDARIDSDPILAFPCVAFLRLVVKKPPTFLVINLCVSRINATQGLASLCEPAFMLHREIRKATETQQQRAAILQR